LIGRPFVKRFTLCYRTVVLFVCPVLSCPVCLSVTLAYCDQTVVWIKMLLGIEVGLGPGYIVLDGDPAPPPPQKGHSPLQFLADVCCGQTSRWINMPLDMKVGLGPGDVVLNGDATLPEGAQPPHFLAHVYCGQTVGHLSYCWSLVDNVHSVQRSVQCVCGTAGSQHAVYVTGPLITVLEHHGSLPCQRSDSYDLLDFI